MSGNKSTHFFILVDKKAKIYYNIGTNKLQRC